MVTDKEIEDGVFKGAQFEVAQKLKLAYAEMKKNGLIKPDHKVTDEEDDKKGYFAMAKEAIHNRTITIPGTDINQMPLERADKLFALMSDRDGKNNLLDSKPSELIPTEEQLKKVTEATKKSVKGAAGFLPIGGTSFFTLITSFFQAIGDLFSGFFTGEGGGFSGFFTNFRTIAGKSTGSAIAANLDNELTSLAKKDVKIGKWLTSSVIENAKKHVQQQAMVEANVGTKPVSYVDALAAVNTDQAFSTPPKLTGDNRSPMEQRMAGLIKEGLQKEGSLLGLASLQTHINEDAIANISAKALAPLVVQHEKTFSDISNTLDGALKSEIKDPKVRKELTIGIATAYLATFGGSHSVPAANNDNLDNAKKLVESTVGTAIGKATDQFKDQVKNNIKSSATFLAPVSMMGMKLLNLSDKFDRGVDAAVESLAGNVKQEKLQTLVSDAVITATAQEYNGKAFYQLAEDEKKKAISDIVKIELQKQFFDIFPGKLTGTHGQIPNAVKDSVIDTIADNIEKGFSFGSIRQAEVVDVATHTPPLANRPLPTAETDIARK